MSNVSHPTLLGGLPLSSVHGNEVLRELLMFSKRKKTIDVHAEVPCIAFGGKNPPNYSFTKTYTEDIKGNIYRYVSSCLYSKKNRINQYWLQKWYGMNFHLFCLFVLLEICHFFYLNRHSMVSFFRAMDLFDLPNPLLI